MAIVSRQLGNPTGAAIVLVSGFGDNGMMYEGLAATALGDEYALVVTDLPGFGDAEPEPEPLGLDRAAELVAEVISEHGARIVIGHSLGSIIASLAATRSGDRVDTMISIEGNLTPEDAYFSGSAAQYTGADDFKAAFLSRLDELAEESDVVRRYRTEVARADPLSLWTLGRDAHRFSAITSPGDVLGSSAARVHYLYNPDNAPSATVEWLEDHDLPRSVLPGASHWKMVDQPDLLAITILDVLHDETLTSDL